MRGGRAGSPARQTWLGASWGESAQRTFCLVSLFILWHLAATSGLLMLDVV